MLATIWRTRDRFGRLVTFTKQGRDHILDRHSDLVARLDELRSIVERPDFVTRDRRFPSRENHYRRERSGSGWIKVVVHYRPVPPQGTWAGEVITAYVLKRRKSKEVQLWP
jgi:hypothetical protein